MKAKVLRTFRDRHKPKKVYKPGEIITLSKERFAEINKTAAEKKIAPLVEEYTEK